MTVSNMILRRVLMTGVAPAALAVVAFPARAEQADNVSAMAVQVAASPATPQDPIEERQSYALRLMMQVYDGREDASHTQLLGVGRIRRGNRSLTLFDYGDGAAVIRGDDGRLSAGRFLNESDPEMAVVYNYDDHSIMGDNAIASFHNSFVRPLLGEAPPLGADATWTARVQLSQTGTGILSQGEVELELSREYFSFEGQQMVLIHYAIPAFHYDAGEDRTVVQWATGISLTDPGFGMIYLNSALHRAVVQQPGLAPRPYRYARTMVAANPDGTSTIDYRDVPQLQPYLDALFSDEAIRVVPPLDAAAEETALPLALAVNLDRIAFSIGENGANETGSATAAQQNGDPTVGGIILDGVEAAATRVNQLGQLVTVTKAGGGVVSLPNFMNAVLSLETQADALAGKMVSLNAQVQQAEDLLATVPTVPEFSERLVQLQRQQEALTRTIDNSELVIEGIHRQISDLEAAGEVVPQALRDELAEAYRIRGDSFQRMRGVTTAMEEASELPNAVRQIPDMSNPRAITALETLEDLAESRRLLEGEAKTVGQLGVELLQAMSISGQRISQALEAFGNSPTGRFLDKLGHVMNFVTVMKAGSNSYTAATTNIGAGDLPLTRDYGYDGWDAILTLGLDLGAMGANALSGNVPGFWSDFTAITAGTFTDTVIAYKGVVDVERLNAQALQDGVVLQRRLTENIERNMREFDARWADKPVLPNYAEGDPYADGYGLPPWPEGEDPADQPATDPSGGGGTITSPAPTRPPIFAEPDPYPKAPPRDPNAPRAEPTPEPTLAEQGFVTQTEQEAWMERVLLENAQAAEELEAYQQELLANRDDESSLPGSYEFRTSSLEMSELAVSTFDIEPVVFEAVTFDMPAFDVDEDLFIINDDGTTSLRKVGPDDFEITPFDPPEISLFPPTDPDDLDGYPGTGQYPAFEWDGLSGTIETDLSKWEDWLATQDVEYLTRLALAAGYPNLASALNDAENIMRLSQDQGYRQWANQAPSCSGYVGCGPSYLGRWSMKRSIVELGDILADSREIFSTGGFSDIGISGFNLFYMLRDFGLEDGDLIDVDIQQFGRTIFSLNGHYLTNAGNSFNVNLRPGVAQMVITALNEGSASPNTAAVTIDNVVRGEAEQTYNLDTGQTAVLRIEANATPETGAGG